MPPREPALRFESLSATPFYLGLIISGIATVFLGPILPVLIARWSLTDSQAGLIFTSQFAASMIGSILSSHFRRKSVFVGYASIATGIAALAFGNYAIGLAAFALIGLGTGATLSATNLIFGTEYPQHRASLLTLVNFCWGIGAVAAPQLIAFAEHKGSIRIFLLLTALVTLSVTVAFTPLMRSTAANPLPSTASPPGRLNLQIFVIFSLMMFLYVGGETAIAGWISTYTHRFANLNPSQSSLVVSAFWLSILAGRGAVPVYLRFFSELTIMLTSLLAAIVALFTLLSPHTAGISLVAVIIAGLGCAPVYPLTVARLLARVGRSRHTGWIFAICSCGGAVLPWLTGFLSERSGSLRTAFAVPLFAVAGIFLCVLLERRIPSAPARLRMN